MSLQHIVTMPRTSKNPTMPTDSSDAKTDTEATMPETPLVPMQVAPPGDTPDKFDSVMERVQRMMMDQKTLMHELRIIKKEFAKMQTRTKSAPKKQGQYGFNKPIDVPSNIRDFINQHCDAKYHVADGSLLSRVQVTGVIYSYITAHELYINGNKQNMVTDATLAKLFDVPEGEEIAFSQFQRYVSRMYGAGSAITTTANIASIIDDDTTEEDITEEDTTEENTTEDESSSTSGAATKSTVKRVVKSKAPAKPALMTA